MNAKTLAAAAALAACALAAHGDGSLMLMRLGSGHTASDEQWAKTFSNLKEYRGACDEVWFSTGCGFPSIEWNREHAKRMARYAEQCRAAGIVPSLQVQSTIGHSDAVRVKNSVMSWRGFTGRGGEACRECSCPRNEKFIEYFREVSRAYAAFRPAWVWIDDDLRIMGHAPASPWSKMVEGWIGCWCPDCIAAFNAETGGAWTRETLDAAMSKDAALYDRWEKFSFAGVANVSRAIAEEFHAISPDSRLAYQHGAYRNDAQLAIFQALHEATGLPVGSRPGGGAYYDIDPYGPAFKGFLSARQRKCLGDPGFIEVWCPEVETYPRTFAGRTAQGILVESFMSLACGMNAVSMLIMSPASETDEWYGRNLLKPISDERPFFDAYVAACAGTVPAGFADNTDGNDREFSKLSDLSMAGVPVLPGPGMAYGEARADDIAKSVPTMTTADILSLRRKLDERVGGTAPVLIETPSLGYVVPRVTADGTLRTVAFLNTRIDSQGPLKVRLRRVPAGAAAVWHEMRGRTIGVGLARDGADAIAEVPVLSAWNCGWLEIK